MFESVLSIVIIYLVPFFVYLSKPFLVKHHKLISAKIIGIVVLTSASFLSLVIKPYWVFTMYAAFFFIIHSLVLQKAKEESRGERRYLAFSLGVYVIYAIAQLWEWPFELTQPIGTPILYAMLQLVPIAFFFHALSERGFKPTSKYLSWVFIALSYGVVLTAGLFYIGVENQYLYYALHLYRLVWLTVFVRALQITFSEKSKDESKIHQIPASQ